MQYFIFVKTNFFAQSYFHLVLFQASTKVTWPGQSRTFTSCYNLRWQSCTLLCPRLKESTRICSKNTSQKCRHIHNDEHILVQKAKRNEKIKTLDFVKRETVNAPRLQMKKAWTVLILSSNFDTSFQSIWAFVWLWAQSFQEKSEFWKKKYFQQDW